MKPYIITHMMISLDGKATGNFLYSSVGESASEYYYGIHRELRTYADGFACGRRTMEESFTKYRQIDLAPYQNENVNAGDFVAEKSDFYAICFDTFGRVGWEDALIHDEDSGYDHCGIIEVVSKRAPKAYLAYLRSKKISYIIAGEIKIDIALALQKLKQLFKINTLILEGGPTLNHSFQREGFVDDLSLVVCPMIAGNDAKTLFLDGNEEEYVLIHHRIHEDGSIYLRYSKS